MVEKTEEKIFSYHSFIFPFLINKMGEEGKVLKKIDSIYSHNEFWQRIGEKESEGHGEDQFHEAIQNYAMDRYFHPEVRNVIWGTNSDIVTNYQVRKEKLYQDAEYIISKEKNDGKKLEYHLKIDKIILKIFNTGVAILLIDCVNSKYDDFEDIISINGYARRVSIPFIPEQRGEEDSLYWRNSVCADELKIKLGGRDLNASFRNKIEEINKSKDISELEALRHYIGECITGLLELGNQSDFHFKTDSTDDAKHIEISPALDETMYVMCLINKTVQKLALSNKAMTSKKKVEDSEKIYQLAFVDEDGCTCQSKEMMRSLMNQHLYDRWIKYGTLYTVTAQAFNCISEHEPSIEAFRRHYLQMCILVLVQHAALISFQNEAMKLSLGLEKRGQGIKNAKIAALMDLQERFIAFQNQINFEEVSSQEQAIDLYQMLRKANHIEELNEAIKEQLDSLYDATNTNQNFSFNKWACILALIALGIDVPTFIYSTGNGLIIGPQENNQLGSHIVIFAATLLLIFMVAYFFSRKELKVHIPRWIQNHRRRKGKNHAADHMS